MNSASQTGSTVCLRTSVHCSLQRHFSSLVVFRPVRVGGEEFVSKFGFRPWVPKRCTEGDCYVVFSKGVLLLAFNHNMYKRNPFVETHDADYRLKQTRTTRSLKSQKYL